jgi:hypothetical protein
MRKIFFVLLLLFSIFSFAQKIDKQNALVTIRGNIGIPRMGSSQMFRTCFSGIAETNLSVNVRLFNNFIVGGGYQFDYFQNNKFLKFRYFNAVVPYNTRMVGHSGFIKIGIDKFFSQGGYMHYSINSGLMAFNYTGVNADTSLANRPYGLKSFTAPFVQPEMSVNFIVDKNLSFSIMLSYTAMFTKFDPKAPRFNHFEEVTKTSNKSIMSWLNIGLGFNVLINKKSKAST